MESTAGKGRSRSGSSSGEGSSQPVSRTSSGPPGDRSRASRTAGANASEEGPAPARQPFSNHFAGVDLEGAAAAASGSSVPAVAEPTDNAGDSSEGSRRERARIASARMAQGARARRPPRSTSNTSDSAGLMMAHEMGQRRRREADERQQRILEQMARINETSSRDATSVLHSGRSGAGSDRLRSRSRGNRRAAELEEAMGHDEDYHDDPLEDLDDLPPMHERFGDLPRARIAPFPFAIGPGAGSEPGLMLGGPGGANALLELLLGNHERFLEQAEEMQMAMAMSLSLEDTGGSGGGDGTQASEMSYENLVELEDVRVTVPKDVLDTLPIRNFNASTVTDADERKCAICQVEYEDKDNLMVLPCGHSFHKECAAEWLTVYSKNCPICKAAVWEAP